MRYLSGEEILVIHAKIIDETGGAHGIRDIGLFLSIIKKPETTFDGKELYGGVFKKAVVYFESLAKYHVFIDGNKRTAIGATARFLFINGYEFIATNKEVEDFTLKVVSSKIDLENIAEWFRKNTRKI